MNWKVFLSWLIIGLALVGIFDASYLTYEHYAKVIPPCSISAFADCGKVLQSEYAVIFGIPLALLGLIHYIVEFLVIVYAVFSRKKIWRRFAFFFTAIGLIVSIGLVYLQIGIIGAICQYCMISALTSILLYIFTRLRFKKDYKDFFHMKMSALKVFLIQPIKQFFSDTKISEKHQHKKLLRPNIKNKYLQSLLNFVPEEKVSEFLHEYQSKH